MGKQYARSSHMLILRAAIIKHHIQVKVSNSFDFCSILICLDLLSTVVLLFQD